MTELIDSPKKLCRNKTDDPGVVFERERIKTEQISLRICEGVSRILIFMNSHDANGFERY